MTTTTKTRPMADWSLAPRGAVSGAVNGFLGVAALAAAAHAVELAPVWAAAGTAVSAIGSIAHSAEVGTHTPTLLYRLCCVLGAGSWVAYTAATTPWTSGAFYTLGLGALAAGALAPWFRIKEPAATARTTRAAVIPRRVAQVAAEWEQRILDVTRIRVEITDVRTWDSKAGYTLTGLLPLDGTTRQQLAGACDQLAAAARLPDGCGVEVAKGPHRGSFVMHVMTVNRLTEDVDWHGDLSARDIHEPAWLGEHRDSSPMTVPLREESVILVGQKGSGKTTVLHGLIWEAARCFNGLTAVIDVNGGSLAQPWLHPWLEGETERPAIDWVASDLDEALEMTRILVEMAIDRKTSYRHLKVKHNLSLLPLSAGLPSYQLLVDEGGELMSTTTRDPIKNEIRDNIEELLRIGRDAGFNTIISSLRAVQDMVSPDVIKQSRVKIGMFCDDEAELAYLFGWNKGADPDELAGPGTGFYRVPGATVRPFKAGYLKHGDIARAAVTIANNRPDLDAAGIAVGGDVYRDRLTRMRKAFGGGKEVALPAEKLRAPQPPAEPAPSPARTSAPHLTVLRGGVASWPDPAEIAATAAAGSLFAGQYDLEPERVETLRAEQVHEVEAGRPLPELLVRALQVIGEDRRIHSVALARALRLEQGELAALLGALGVRTLPNPFERGGEKLRGYERQHLEEAANAIRRGELQVPPEVADWPAA
ncbi:hypothetical protein SAMN05216275_14190 [Streptosporangium canum]|uniref:FtsK domain-containing protein n=1 Tax=Streptosporangium canum TaxID=324952 RepID=A0A1I4DMD4_9ACTN|nr:ATP-binding protein [Streptosporangium canum]SFK93071.1 hypothetical protein SAMN05216275_14190 [Streptosporangium canum]